MHTNISTSALHTLQYTNNQNKNIPSDKATTVLVPLLKPTGTGHQIRHNITKNLKKKKFPFVFIFQYSSSPNYNKSDHLSYSDASMMGGFMALQEMLVHPLLLALDLREMINATKHHPMDVIVWSCLF